MPVSSREIVGLGAFLAATFAAAGIGAQFVPGVWYERLDKPLWTPPDWVFAPVWSVLYLMIAIAAWLVWRRLSALGWPAIIWLTQLVLNTMWSWLFFGLQRPGLAALEIVVLFAAILVTAYTFIRIHLLAGVLLVPYLIWVAFAALLNVSIWRLNS